MNRNLLIGWWAVLAMSAAGGGRAAAPDSRPKILAEWNFEQEGSLEEWQPNGHLQEVRVAQGVLACRAAGSDPILELRSRLDLAATPWQVLETRLKADRDGVAEFFWSNTDQGRYGGFSGEKTTRFNVVGDSQWHTYRLLPCWHPEGKIVRLRFDLFDGGRFAIDSIRILGLPPSPAAPAPVFDFTQGPAGWQPFGGITAASQPGGLKITTEAGAGFLLGPPVQFAAEDLSYVGVCLAADRGTRATLFFATGQAAGWHSQSFPITADGREHFYNVDLLAATAWRGRVVALGLRPSDAAGSTVLLRRLQAGDQRLGPPDLKLASFDLEEALPRAGLPATLSAQLENAGGQTATNLRAGLILPPGLTVDQNPPTLKSLELGGTLTLAWKIQCTQPLTGRAELYVTANNAPGVSAAVPVAFTAVPKVPPGDYLPEPQPVRGPYEVGAYYFPGWKQASQWQPLQRFPERRPVLGWYREGDPEVADWHIKWAVEHGITFFAYDWYWSQGSRQLEHALHDGFFKARFRRYLKFCLLWANHNAPHTSSREDCLAVTRHWLDQYFTQPEYLKLDGKPVVIIFNPQGLTLDLGHDQVPAAFAAMREECQRRGLPGLYLMACVGEAAQARLAAQEGYDAVTAYNWPGLGMPMETQYAPYETLLPGYVRQWEQIMELSAISLCPPVNGGWDSRPWHGDNNLVRYGRTPALFEKHLLDARRLLETQPKTRKLILVEAWNEWGEGSYIEPHREFGFGYLDAIRNVFTPAAEPHTDLAPADVKRGPFGVDLDLGTPSAWIFNQSNPGWDNVMDLTGVEVRDGALTGRTTGNDPAFFSPPTLVRAGEFSVVLIRMKLEDLSGRNFADSAQLFWRTTRLPESEASSVRFPVLGDGQWHDYRVPLAINRRWRDQITRLRLDPCNRPGVRVAISTISLKP